MKYSAIVDAYEKIEATTRRTEMTDLLVQLFRQTPIDVIEKVSYLTQGKLHPDYVGVELGLAEKLAIRSLATVADMSEGEVQESFGRTGDLGQTASDILSRKAQSRLSRHELTVENVYSSFDNIARASGPGSVESKVKLLSKLLDEATPTESKYILRMALGKLRLGVADMTMLDALAVAFGGGKEARPLLERAYNLSSDLGHVAKTVASAGMRAIQDFHVTMGRPVRAMLAERLSDPSEILQKLGGRAAAEYKYDGLRIQAHIREKDVVLFSRRLENITSQFPDVCSYLVQASRVQKVIVEGECVAVDPNTGDPLPFQIISQRRGRKHEVDKMAEEIPVAVFLFDLLYVSDTDLTNRPLPERRKALFEIFRETDQVKLSHQKIVSNQFELEEFLSQAVSWGCEGLVVKSLEKDSEYRAGARGWVWIKYKRDYTSEMQDTVDLTVVGAFFGRGRRAGMYGAVLLASYEPNSDRFMTVCKCGSGFTDQDLAKLGDILRQSTVERQHVRVESKLEADVWFRPSIVLEVTGSEITLSPIHTCGLNAIRRGSGFAIRFPRFTGRYRTDKSPEDSTKPEEFLSMYKAQLRKLSGGVEGSLS